METAVRIQISVHGDQLLLERDGMNQVEEEGLSGAILSDDQTEG
jgi:hypothetical protein